MGDRPTPQNVVRDRLRRGTERLSIRIYAMRLKDHDVSGAGGAIPVFRKRIPRADNNSNPEDLNNNTVLSQPSPVKKGRKTRPVLGERPMRIAPANAGPLPTQACLEVWDFLPELREFIATLKRLVSQAVPALDFEEIRCFVASHFDEPIVEEPVVEEPVVEGVDEAAKAEELKAAKAKELKEAQKKAVNTAVRQILHVVYEKQSDVSQPGTCDSSTLVKILKRPAAAGSSPNMTLHMPLKRVSFAKHLEVCPEACEIVQIVDDSPVRSHDDAEDDDDDDDDNDEDDLDGDRRAQGGEEVVRRIEGSTGTGDEGDGEASEHDSE